MAKMKFNPIFAEISGKMGGVVFRRSKQGEVIIARYSGESNSQPSEAQRAQQERFAQAVAYAKAAMADPLVRAHYERQSATLHKRPHDLAVSDYFKDRNLLQK